MYAQETKGQDCAVRAPEVHGGIGCLEDTVSRMESSLANLDSRLSCVSRCSPPTVASNNKVPQLVAGYACGVGSRLGGLRERLDGLAATIADITDRLEI